MITFFRNIRKSLSGSGQARRYILYAGGEIALVVIGILMALQINNWNTDRINRSAEKEILSRIIGDLETDLNNIALSGESNEERILRGVWVMENLGIETNKFKSWDCYKKAIQNYPEIESLVANSMGSTIMQIRYYFLFEESNITMQEIMATGKLDIIRDEQTKVAIQSHYAELEKLKFLQRLLLTNRDDLVKYLLDNNISILNDLNTQGIISRLGGHEKLVAYIENYLDATRVVYRNISADDASIKSSTEALIKEIKTYLNTI